MKRCFNLIALLTALALAGCASLGVSDYLARGREHAGQGRYDAAAADFDRAIELDPNHAPVYLYRAIMLMDQGRYAEAIADNTRVIEIEPSYDAYYNRSLCYGHLGRYDEAIADCGRAIEIDPNIVDAYVNRGYMYPKIPGKIMTTSAP
jgi:tetratricopeptide (TPR) repeat protein